MAKPFDADHNEAGSTAVTRGRCSDVDKNEDVHGSRFRRTLNTLKWFKLYSAALQHNLRLGAQINHLISSLIK